MPQIHCAHLNASKSTVLPRYTNAFDVLVAMNAFKFQCAISFLILELMLSVSTSLTTKKLNHFMFRTLQHVVACRA